LFGRPAVVAQQFFLTGVHLGIISVARLVAGPPRNNWSEGARPSTDAATGIDMNDIEPASRWAIDVGNHL
jgi:hypothetical protein